MHFISNIFMKFCTTLCTLLLVAWVCWQVPPAHARNATTAPPPALDISMEGEELEALEEKGQFPSEVNATLRGLLDAIENLGLSIKSKEEQFRRASTDSQRRVLEEEINILTGVMQDRLDSFEDVAAGVDLDEFSPTEEQAVDFSQDFKELLAPLLVELKNLTARPRDLERLRAEISRYEVLLARINAGLERMATVRNSTQDKNLVERLDELILQWKRRRDDTSSALNVSQLRLKEKLADDGSIFDVVKRLFQNFFLTRGKNFLLALLAGAAVFTVLRLAQRAVMQSSRGRRWAKHSMFFRAFTVVYTFICSIFAFLAGLGVLYSTGDWVLLGLSALLLVGVLWSAKYNLRNFSEQIKLLCNLGGVREGERMVYRGIQYRVGRINYYTTLYNPLLQGGIVRLPLDELYDKTSRPVHREEAWFPTKKGDYVLMSDAMYGQVLVQSPEEVIIEVWGGNRQHYQTSDFLAMRPRNLSSGFGHFVTVGIDYEHQPKASRDIPMKMQEELEAGFAAAGLTEHITCLLVEFSKIDDSALTLAIWVSFTGDMADRYYGLGRLVNKLALESCTANGWGIPFPQRVLHVAPGSRELFRPVLHNHSTEDTNASY